MDQGVADDVESVLHGWGMPDDKWWRGADSAYISCCRILGNDLIPGHDAPRAGEPVVSVVPDGNFACHLSAQGDELNVAVVGSIRKSLFVEVVWQNILELQDSGVTIKVFQMSERKMVFEVGSFVFSVQYTECEELVRNFPRIIDAPEEFISELRVEVGELVERLQYLAVYKISVLESWQHRALFYFLSSWTALVGLRGNKLGSVDSGDLRELTWDIVESSNKDVVLEEFLNFLGRHKACRWSSRESCGFYNTRLGTTTRSWSSSQFGYFHQTMETMLKAILNRRQRVGSRNIDVPGILPTTKRSEPQQLSDEIAYLVEYLSQVTNLPPVERLGSAAYIRVSLLYSGQSQLRGTAMMKFVEDRIVVLVERLEKASTDIYIRSWPCPLTEETATENNSPYEGCWLIGISHISAKIMPVNAVKEVLSQWNENIYQSARYSEATMAIHAEFQYGMDFTTLREDPKRWPRPIIEPDSIFTNEKPSLKITKRPEKAQMTSGVPGKLRPALEVLSRLKHDARFDLDDHVVGYTDRHSGIMEKPAGVWIMESTDEEWIPQSRIQHFRRVSDNCVIWDRVTKKDLVFRQ